MVVEVCFIASIYLGKKASNTKNSQVMFGNRLKGVEFISEITSVPIPIPSISISVHETIDTILDRISFKTKYNVLVVNRTGGVLKRVGTHNDSANWPVGDIEANTADPEGFEGNPITNSFSFASNYKTADGKYFQFVATWPTIGSRKIGLDAINQEGNDPAKQTWDKTYDSNDKAVNNLPYQARAFMKTRGSSVIWVYEVSKSA